MFYIDQNIFGSKVNLDGCKNIDILVHYQEALYFGQQELKLNSSTNNYFTSICTETCAVFHYGSCLKKLINFILDVYNNHETSVGKFIKCEKSGSKGEILSIFARKNENKILE